MKQQTKPTNTLDAYIDRVINETVRSTLQRRALQEKEVQQQASSGDKAPSDEEKDKLQKGDVAPEDIIEKLNSIRSGKSFKDQQIFSALTKYVADMSKAEKTALFAFLKGISQIVTGEFEAEAAVDPSDKAPGIEMKKTTSGQKVVIKPKVVKASEQGKEKLPAEDTKGPVPISPKSK
jgi:hypothetical protein